MNRFDDNAAKEALRGLQKLVESSQNKTVQNSTFDTSENSTLKPPSDKKPRKTAESTVTTQFRNSGKKHERIPKRLINLKGLSQQDRDFLSTLTESSTTSDHDSSRSKNAADRKPQPIENRSRLKTAADRKPQIGTCSNKK